MQDKLDLALSLLHNQSYSLVAIKDSTIHTATGIGVKPIMEKMRTNRTYFSCYLVADKVIGKAAALLLILSGATYIYGNIMSKTAIEVLEKYNIPYSYGQIVDYISNRTNTGMCPLENSVKDTDDPKLAFSLIEQTIQELMANR